MYLEQNQQQSSDNVFHPRPPDHELSCQMENFLYIVSTPSCRSIFKVLILSRLSHSGSEWYNKGRVLQTTARVLAQCEVHERGMQKEERRGGGVISR
ncbi:hypothetical protein INR49_001779 [Caranx melampygus]|nr:hypothetical protein INR49_001779 [Caranx melampygus]